MRHSALRDERVLALVAQAVLALGLVLVLALGVQSLLADLDARGLTPGFGFLEHEAGFGIGEGPAFTETDPVGRAFLVGLANTLRVALVGIVLATVLGLAVALGRISGNPLLATPCRWYVDAFRNTPLLVQLVFWYRGFVLQLPGLHNAVVVGTESGAFAILSQRGIAVPRVGPSAGTELWLAAAVLGIVLGLQAVSWRRRVQARTGRPARGLAWGGAAFALTLAGAWLVAPQPPGTVGLPAITSPSPTSAILRFEGGWVLTPEFLALLIGLTTYTAAFIAEVFRAGIESVSRGQREAGLAIGLRAGQLLRHVVLPQALRVVVPPLTSQYLNLTKNSSLAIAIGYPDLFNIGRTISNQTGQAVMVIAMMMAVYLAISLVTSLLMNLYNRRVRLVER